jgi:predicted DNA-binding protein (UPF0251 family)
VEGVNIVPIIRENLNAKNVEALRYVRTENLNQFAKNVEALRYVCMEDIKLIANRVEVKMCVFQNGVT